MFSSVSSPLSTSFGQRLASSAAFDTLFRDGMTLVEETASYLDGEGRDTARSLPRTEALAYAAESMRLTTRLMQIASWLLLQRAVNEGELSLRDAAEEKGRSRAAWSKEPAGLMQPTSCPARLEYFIEQSMQLQQRVQRLDKLLVDPDSVPASHVHPLAPQMEMLRAAFQTAN